MVATRATRQRRSQIRRRGSGRRVGKRRLGGAARRLRRRAAERRCRRRRRRRLRARGRCAGVGRRGRRRWRGRRGCRWGRWGWRAASRRLPPRLRGWPRRRRQGRRGRRQPRAGWQRREEARGRVAWRGLEGPPLRAQRSSRRSSSERAAACGEGGFRLALRWGPCVPCRVYVSTRAHQSAPDCTRLIMCMSCARAPSQPPAQPPPDARRAARRGVHPTLLDVRCALCKCFFLLPPGAHAPLCSPLAAARKRPVAHGWIPQLGTSSTATPPNLLHTSTERHAITHAANTRAPLSLSPRSVFHKWHPRAQREAGTAMRAHRRVPHTAQQRGAASQHARAAAVVCGAASRRLAPAHRPLARAAASSLRDAPAMRSLVSEDEGEASSVASGDWLRSPSSADARSFSECVWALSSERAPKCGIPQARAGTGPPGTQ